MNKEQYKTYLRQALHTIFEVHDSEYVAQGHQAADSGDLLAAIGDSPTYSSVSRLFTDAGFDPRMLYDFTIEDLGQYTREQQIAIATGSRMTHLHPDYDAKKHGTGRSVVGIENLLTDGISGYPNTSL